MVSGPIRRNQTFFLVAYEGLRQRQFRDTLTTVPTDRQRTGDFSDTRASVTQLINIFDPATTRPTRTVRAQFAISFPVISFRPPASIR